jgi:hypothetical protein
MCIDPTTVFTLFKSIFLIFHFKFNKNTICLSCVIVFYLLNSIEYFSFLNISINQLRDLSWSLFFDYKSNQYSQLIIGGSEFDLFKMKFKSKQFIIYIWKSKQAMKNSNNLFSWNSFPDLIVFSVCELHIW